MSKGTNQSTGVTESSHFQRRDWVDEGEIKGKNWSSKNPSKTDWQIEEKQKLFDRWRNESRWRITKTFSFVINVDLGNQSIYKLALGFVIIVCFHS